jgi:alanine dehydrogenase
VIKPAKNPIILFIKVATPIDKIKVATPINKAKGDTTMIIGIPKEIKSHENRVGMTPAGVADLVANKHTVYVESGAGAGSDFADVEYTAAGATILPKAADVWSKAEMIIKVKEPLEPEFALFKPGQIIFTYLHLAPDNKLTDALLAAKVIGVAYETIELPDRSLPLLTPMSEVAGRMAI